MLEEAPNNPEIVEEGGGWYAVRTAMPESEADISEDSQQDFGKTAAEAENKTVEPVVRHILRMDNGAEYEIVSEDGVYYYCGETQFRRGNRHIQEVMES